MLLARLMPLVAIIFWGAIRFDSVFANEVDFTRDIKPILSNRCFFCHGPDPEERKGGKDGLRLDKRDAALEDLGGYAAIVPGDVSRSVLIERVISTDPDTVMPPPERGNKLNPHEIDLLRKWVEQGAGYSEHWSYVRPSRPQLPTVSQTDWPRNEIDYFILSRLEKAGLSPTSPADRYSIIRRLTLDLTGLPPTLAEVDAFIADPSETAYESLVDRLLQQKSYGEHWARLWLDLARYADSAGYADDPSRTIWLYRDYVIKSLNANKPFDQFTIEQIAGDLLPDATDEQLVATAFHRNTLTNNEGGTNDEEFRNAAIIDRVNTTLAVWMGTTMACAQCHTHKFDPITQAEYFKVFAILNNTADADLRDEAPLLSVYTPEQQQQRESLQNQLAQVKTVLTTTTPELQAAQNQWEAEFPHELSWRPLTPDSVNSQAGAKVVLEGSIANVSAGPDTDTYTIDAPLPTGPIQAIRLEALTNNESSEKGPGHAGGNFVVTGVHATITPSSQSTLNGRFVRVEIPGPNRILSLAEVQVFQGDKNIALEAEATQSSTAFAGPAKLAIDGNTDGEFTTAKSTTHTDTTADPWWELDLKTTSPIDRLVIWNRTDGGTGDRLVNFRVSVLDDARKTIWQVSEAPAPRPNREFSKNGPRSIAFTQAFADYHQPNFDPASVLKNPDPKSKGWAIGGATNQEHQLVLLTDSVIDCAADSRLTLTIEQLSQHAKHTLGRFRVSVTGDQRAAIWARTPPAVIDALSIADKVRSQDQRNTITEHYRSIAPSLDASRKQKAELEKRIADVKPVTVPVMRELADDRRRTTHIQIRGNFLNLGEVVQPGTPAAFAALTNDRPADRLAFARWLVDDANPLTARVIANRYWERLFGTGLVSTSEDFGSQGEYPSHPELLDWLATELVRLKWDTKALIKTLVMSAAYRQSSQAGREAYESDPDNRLIARGPRFRLTAETIRDQALAVSGLLSDKLFGPPVNPPQPSTGLNAAFGGGIDWQTSKGQDRYRRGLYTTWRRSNPYPSMTTFDAPNREVCTLRRNRSNTPLQALVTLNDPVYMEAAQGLARRIMLAPGTTLPERATYGFRLCLSRPPKAQELERLLEMYETAKQEFNQKPEQATKFATDPLGPVPETLTAIELAAWTTVANVLLNLDETLMPR